MVAGPVRRHIRGTRQPASVQTSESGRRRALPAPGRRRHALRRHGRCRGRSRSGAAAGVTVRDRAAPRPDPDRRPPRRRRPRPRGRVRLLAARADRVRPRGRVGRDGARAGRPRRGPGRARRTAAEACSAARRARGRRHRAAAAPRRPALALAERGRRGCLRRGARAHGLEAVRREGRPKAPLPGSSRGYETLTVRWRTLSSPIVFISPMFG